MRIGIKIVSSTVDIWCAVGFENNGCLLIMVESGKVDPYILTFLHPHKDKYASSKEKGIM